MTLFDPGLQPERTELAWRRTALSVFIGSLVALRLLPVALGSTFWITPGLMGLILAATLWSSARRRYRRGSRALDSLGAGGHLPDGSLLGLTAVATAMIGILGTILVLAMALDLTPAPNM